METWVKVITDNGIAIFMIVYWCYMNAKYNQTILESLTCIKEMLHNIREGEED